MTKHWEPVTIRLTAKQARVLWGFCSQRVAYAAAGTDRSVNDPTWRAILRKLEGTR